MPNTTSGPLAGIRVLDFCTLLPGPIQFKLHLPQGAASLKVTVFSASQMAISASEPMAIDPFLG